MPPHETRDQADPLQPFISVQNLHHTHSLGDGGQVVALQGIDLNIDRGEFVAIVGANGSGKSTLAHHLNALLLPSSGRVCVDGLDTSEPGNLWAVRRRVGMVFQNPDNQLVASTVEEDVAFGPENAGMPSREMRSRVDKALELVGLTDQALRPPHMLSGGQRQLVAIAGVLATQPECIVLDEPTSMLDPVGRRQVLSAVQRLNSDRALTIVLITQSMAEAATAGRVLVLDAGRIAIEGPPQRVFEQRERLLALGLDIPTATQIAYALRYQGIEIPEGVNTIEGLVGVLC